MRRPGGWAATLPVLPEDRALAAGLTAALDRGRPPSHPFTLLERRRPPITSSSPNEIVRCRFGDGRARTVFVKLEAGEGHRAFGHRGGTAYEAEVYRWLLAPRTDFRPRFLGAYVDPASGATW